MIFVVRLISLLLVTFWLMYVLADIRQSWVTSSRCVFHIDKVLITRPNTITQIYYIIPLLYTATCFGCPDRPSSGRSRIHKKKYKRREASVYSAVNCNDIIPINGKIRLKRMHIVLRNSLGIDHCETAMWMWQQRVKFLRYRSLWSCNANVTTTSGEIW
jgi:hypothetical protein